MKTINYCPNCQNIFTIEDEKRGWEIVESHSHKCPYCNMNLKKHYNLEFYIFYMMIFIVVSLLFVFLVVYYGLSLYLEAFFILLSSIISYLILKFIFYPYMYDRRYIEFILDAKQDNNKKLTEEIMSKSFVYNIPTKVHFGENVLVNLNEELAKYGKKVLLTYGKGSIKRTGLYERIIALLNRDEFEIYELSDIEPNPTIDSVKRGVDILKEHDIDVILAVGGGSVIDASKIMAAARYYEDDAWDVAKGAVDVKNALPIITVLTIAATGSEMNPNAVITNPETKDKKGSHYKLLYPKVSFLDPTLTYSVNEYQTACGSADIFSHILESYMASEKSMFMLDSMMEALMKTVVKYSKVAIAKPDDYEARANLMWASSWAINGFVDEYEDKSWSVHSLEHPLSAYYDITHGLGLAILMPRWLKYILDDKTVNKIASLGINVFNIEDNEDKYLVANQTIEALAKYLYEDLKIASSFNEIDINEDFFIDMAYKATKGKKLEGIKTLSIDDAIAIYKNCIEKYEVL